MHAATAAAPIPACRNVRRFTANASGFPCRTLAAPPECRQAPAPRATAKPPAKAVSPLRSATAHQTGQLLRHIYYGVRRQRRRFPSHASPRPPRNRQAPSSSPSSSSPPPHPCFPSLPWLILFSSLCPLCPLWLKKSFLAPTSNGCNISRHSPHLFWSAAAATPLFISRKSPAPRATVKPPAKAVSPLRSATALQTGQSLPHAFYGVRRQRRRFSLSHKSPSAPRNRQAPSSSPSSSSPPHPCFPSLPWLILFSSFCPLCPFCPLWLKNPFIPPHLRQTPLPR